MLAEIYQWSMDIHARGVIEGINRAIKGLKWQAYGYKNMEYFKLKIMQKVGYLNHKFALKWKYELETN